MPMPEIPQSISDLPPVMHDPAAIARLNDVLGVAVDWGGQTTLFTTIGGKPEPRAEKDAKLPTC